MYQTIIVSQEEWTENPREWADHLCTFYGFHRNYNIGDDLSKVLGWNAQYLPKSVEGLAAELVREKMRGAQLYADFTPNSESAERWVEEFEEYEEYPPSFDDFLDAAGDGDNYLQPDLAEWFDLYYYFMPVYMYEHSGVAFSTGPFSCPWDSGQVGIIWLDRDRAQKELSEPTDDLVEKIMRAEIEEYSAWASGDIWQIALFEHEEEEADPADLHFGEWEDSMTAYGYSEIDRCISDMNADEGARVFYVEPYQTTAYRYVER